MLTSLFASFDCHGFVKEKQRYSNNLISSDRSIRASEELRKVGSIYAINWEASVKDVSF